MIKFIQKGNIAIMKSGREATVLKSWKAGMEFVKTNRGNINPIDILKVKS